MWIDVLTYCAEILAPSLGWTGLISLTAGAVLAIAPAPRPRGQH